MNREQMIAWFIIEGIYVADYNGNGNLYEAWAYGKSSTIFYSGNYANDDDWAVFGYTFDGGPTVEWCDIPDKFIYSLYVRVQKDFHHEP